MKRITKKFQLFALLLLFITPLFHGCEGSAPREQVDDTVKELSGQKKVEQMKQMKTDIGVIESQQADRMKQLDDELDK